VKLVINFGVNQTAHTHVSGL